MRSYRLLILVAALAVAAAGGTWFLLRPPPYATVTPTRGDAAEIIYASGIVEPKTWAKVSSLSRERLVEVCACEGQSITKGTVLARLDDSEERATLAELQARRTLANAGLRRLLQLGEHNVASIQEVDRARSESAQLEALVVGQQARIETLVLRSPMDGVVLRRDGEVGEIAEPDSVLFWVGQLKPLIVTAEVNEEDIPRVEIGQRALLRADAFADRELEASVDTITPKGDPVNKTYRVRFALPDDTPLRIGMTVDVNIVVRTSKNALLVPSAAVSGSTIFVVDEDGRAQRRDLSVGIRGATDVEVLSGVGPGDRVISPYPEGLSDKVREKAG